MKQQTKRVKHLDKTNFLRLAGVGLRTNVLSEHHRRREVFLFKLPETVVEEFNVTR